MSFSGNGSTLYIMMHRKALLNQIYLNRQS